MQKIEPNSETKLYSPLFSVRYNTVYNKDTKTEETIVTRILRSDYSNPQHNQAEIYVTCATMTAKIVEDFYKNTDTAGWQLTVQIPEATKMKRIKTIFEKDASNYPNKRPTSRTEEWYAPVLKEKYFPDTQNIFCNSGWVTEKFENMPEKLLLALPHYSFVWSEKEYMIGSIQASIDIKEKKITIIAPTLMSKIENQYGYEDTGEKGMGNYFHWNKSSSFVPQFEKPQYSKSSYEPNPGNKTCGNNSDTTFCVEEE